MGHVQLRRGRVEEAREHAVWALRGDPRDRTALLLLAAVKTRGNPFLGLWWRFSTWMGSLGDGRAILVLLAGYAAYRIAVISLDEADQKGLASLISLLWLAFAAYTWVGPAIFQRAVRRELAEVRLDKSF